VGLNFAFGLVGMNFGWVGDSQDDEGMIASSSANRRSIALAESAFVPVDTTPDQQIGNSSKTLHKLSSLSDAKEKYDEEIGHLGDDIMDRRL
jgi:hypothetical protein